LFNSGLCVILLNLRGWMDGHWTSYCINYSSILYYHHYGCCYGNSDSSGTAAIRLLMRLVVPLQIQLQLQAAHTAIRLLLNYC